MLNMNANLPCSVSETTADIFEDDQELKEQARLARLKKEEEEREAKLAAKEAEKLRKQKEKEEKEALSAEEYEMVTAASEFKIKWFFFGNSDKNTEEEHIKESD